MPKGIYFHKKGIKKPLRTEEHKRKLSLAKLGKPRSGNPKNWKHSEESKIKMSKSAKNKFINGYKHPMLYKHQSKEMKKKLSEIHKGKHHSISTQFKKGDVREKSPNWINDRSKLKKSPRKDLDTQYKYWVKEVRTRDRNKCRLLNNDCSGRLESHHILNWIDYPELRYIINNGITLCAFHHPKKWEEEKRMIPIFQELLSVSKE